MEKDVYGDSTEVFTEIRQRFFYKKILSDLSQNGVIIVIGKKLNEKVRRI